MNFKKHYELQNEHSYLSGSKYHWMFYDEAKLSASYKKFLAVRKGTELHDLAKRLIELKIKLPKTKNTFNLYVNDAIGYRMIPEQPLFYSLNAFGTADAISFRNNLLRIHDLKTGVTRVSIHQLEVYTALFCLEYSINPKDIEAELRIYQSNEVLVHIPDLDDIMMVIDKIISFDKIIEKIKSEEGV